MAPPRRAGTIGELPKLPEARVWYPTEEQFKDFYGYIRRIQPEAHTDGISLIVPPPSWKPPFQLDPSKLRFNTRVQKINELFERSVLRVRFLTCLREFHDAQGTPLTHIPVLAGHEVDLYRLYNAVAARGGFESVCAARGGWADIARALNYQGLSHVPQALRQAYAKLLLAYEQLPDERKASALHDKEARSRERIEQEGVLTGSLMSARAVGLAGGGGKEHGAAAVERSNELVDGGERVIAYEPPEPGREVCEVCRSGQDDSRMILCDRCNCGFHIYCLTPPLSAVPAGDWLCDTCLGERFGFGSGGRYTHFQFARSAHAFKRAFFETVLGKRAKGEALTDVSVDADEVEWQFWNAVDNSAKPLQVLYGSDVDSLEVGSGFERLPELCTQRRHASAPPPPKQSPFAAHPFNVNNIGARSLLAALGQGISGMVVPWLYFGMLFSSFCWHVEDHLCHSVNYMHSGAPKTWYGVAAEDRSRFEAAMRAAAPELFAHESGLLYRMVTMVPPWRAADAGVQVTRLLQRAGTFVVTWPAAYHAGFSHGLNCAESTNFGAEDWLPWGRLAADEARSAPGSRALCFNHERLLCALAERAASLRVYTLAWLQPEVARLVALERERREAFVAAEHARAKPLKTERAAEPCATALEPAPARAPHATPAAAAKGKGGGGKGAHAAAAAAVAAPRCATCSYDLAVAYVRCPHCAATHCLVHGGAEHACACASARALVCARSLEELAQLQAAVDARALPYLRWRRQVRALRLPACAPQPAADGALGARRAPQPGGAHPQPGGAQPQPQLRPQTSSPWAAQEGAAPSGGVDALDAVEAGGGAEHEQPALVLSYPELEALRDAVPELGLDDDDADAARARAACAAAGAWAASASQHGRAASNGAAAKLPGGGRASADSLAALLDEHDSRLPAAFPAQRAALGALHGRVCAWRARASELVQMETTAGTEGAPPPEVAVSAEALEAHVEAAHGFALQLPERPLLTQRAAGLRWLAASPGAMEARLPLGALKALVEKGKRLGLGGLPEHAQLSARLAAAHGWAARADAAVRAGSDASELGHLLDEAAALERVEVSEKLLAQLASRRAALGAWEAETAETLARAPPHAATADELAAAKQAAARLRVSADGGGRGAELLAALSSRIGGAAAWRKAATSLLAKPGARRPLAAILADDGLPSAEENNHACDHCAAEDELTPAHVAWVGCDTCPRWVHAHCIGLDADAAAGLGAYTCARCAARSPARPYPLGEPPPRVLTARPPLAALDELLTRHAALGAALPEATAALRPWAAEARAWELRAMAAVARAAAGAAWQPPSPPRPVVPMAVGTAALATGGNTPTPSARTSARAARKRATKPATNAPGPTAGAALPQPEQSGGDGSEGASAAGLAAARACVDAYAARTQRQLLPSLIESARGLQVRAELEDVAITLELVVRELERRASA